MCPRIAVTALLHLGGSNDVRLHGFANRLGHRSHTAKSIIGRADNQIILNKIFNDIDMAIKIELSIFE